MILEEQKLAGLFLVHPEPIADSRGFFARLFCAKAFHERGLNPHLEQISMSYNARAGTLRGLHIQRPPFCEAKLVRVTRGAIFDVVVDVRRRSATFGQWLGFELSSENRRQLYIPEGLAHGFQTLVPETEVLYHISVPYQPGSASGVRWDDPDLAIAWPELSGLTISERDAGLPLLAEFEPVEV